MAREIIKGLDHGYYATKDDEGRIFKSAFTRTDRTLSDDNKIIINGNTYYFGKGNPIIDPDKIDTELNRVCTWSNFALTGDCDIFLVVGLPIGQYNTKKDKFRDMILSYNGDEVIYKGKKVNNTIKDVSVFAQGVGALFNYPIPNRQYIIFDVGSYTINVILIDFVDGIPHILEHKTWYDGVYTLYEKISSEAMLTHPELTIDISEAEDIMKNGLSIYDTKIDTSFVDRAKEDYLDMVLSNFKIAFKSKYNKTPILLCGGGGILMKQLFEGRLNNAILLPDSQFANAQGYNKFGEQKYGRYLSGRR